MKKILIYGLISTEDLNIIRYVGKTHQKIKKRIHDHIRESYKRKTKKDIWIQETLANGFEINHTIIEECNGTNWLEKEKYWISKLDNLTNTSKGGDGGKGLLAIKSFNELKKFTHTNMINVKNSVEWVEFVKNNSHFNFLPKYPYASYKNRGWTSWEDLLINYNGTEDRRNAFRPIFNYDECRDYLKQFKIKGIKNFKKEIKYLDSRIPSAPSEYYKKNNTWINWMDFLSYD